MHGAKLIRCGLQRLVFGWGVSQRYALVFGLLAALDARAQFTPSSPTTLWTPLPYPTGALPDAPRDQQFGGSELDIVGDLSHPSLYMHYTGGPGGTNGLLAFRLRLAADPNPPGYKGAAFVGLDADGNGTLDLFVGVDNHGNGNQTGIWMPGSSANTSPATTTLAGAPAVSYSQTPANYSFVEVTAAIDPTTVNFDLDAGGQSDRFLSFIVRFEDVRAQLAGRGILDFTGDSPFEAVAYTATQPSKLNGDINGLNGGIGSVSTWTQLGAFTDTYTPLGPVPEPSPHSLLSLSAGLVLLLRHQRRFQPS